MRLITDNETLFLADDQCGRASLAGASDRHPRRILRTARSGDCFQCPPAHCLSPKSWIGVLLCAPPRGADVTTRPIAAGSGDPRDGLVQGCLGDRAQGTATTAAAAPPGEMELGSAPSPTRRHWIMTTAAHKPKPCRTWETVRGRDGERSLKLSAPASAAHDPRTYRRESFHGAPAPYISRLSSSHVRPHCSRRWESLCAQTRTSTK